MKFKKVLLIKIKSRLKENKIQKKKIVIKRSWCKKKKIKIKNYNKFKM